MRPLFVPDGQRAPAQSLGVDGVVAGCERLYSHWPGHPPPAEIAADSATAILLRAARDPARWLDGFAHCCIDHLDADGLLAVCLACRPDLVVLHGPLMVAAAAYGDFDAWTGEAGARLALRLHQLLRSERDAGGAWQQRCLEHVVDHLQGLVAESDEHEPERDAQIAQILAAREAIGRGREAVIRLIDQDPIIQVRTRHLHGHHPSDCFTVHQIDDCPTWALDGHISRARFQQLILQHDEGSVQQIDAPRHSWAHTVHLPRVEWPDCSDLARTLSSEDGPGRSWIAGAEARRRGFTCVLASVDPHGNPAPSQIDPDLVAERFASLLR